MNRWHPFRLLPEITAQNQHFWKSGATGSLEILCCKACSTWIHPPAPICPACLSRDVEPRAVSGRATLASFTVNHQPWIPGFDPPYVVALVELPEQAGLRLTTNLIDCAPEDARIGMPVEICFDEYDGVWIPLARPAAGGGAP